MVALLKKRITSDFFHVALFLTLLHGEFLYNPLIQNIDNYINELNSTTDNNYGLTTTSTYNNNFNNGIRSYFDPPVHLLTRKGYDDYQLQQDYVPPQAVEDDILSQHGRVLDEFDYRHIVEELRRLTQLQRPSFELDALIGKAPSFQDFMTYLVNNTTNSVLPNGFASTPNEPASTSSGGYFEALGVIHDDNDHVDNIVSANQQVEVQEDPENESLIQVSETIFDGSDNELENFVNEDVVKIAQDGIIVEDDLMLRTTGYLNESFFFDAETLNEKPLENENQHNLQSEFGSEILGATALWPPSSPLLVDNEIVQEQNMEDFNYDSMYDLHGQDASAMEVFDNYRHTYEDEDLLTVISPLAIHRYTDAENDFEGSSPVVKEEEEEETGSLSRENGEDVQSNSITNEKRSRGISTCSSISSRRSSFKSTNSPSSTAHHSPSHDEPASNFDEDDVDEMAEINANSTIASAVNSLIEELWETDSGIFDSILEEPTSDSQTQESPLHAGFGLENLPEAFADLAFDEDFASIGNESPENTLNNSEHENSASTAAVEDDMIQTAPFHSNVRPTSHAVQPRGFQVHARMPGLLRGTSMDQRWQELANILSLQNPHDPTAGPLPPPLPHHFGAHHHHHHHPLHHPSTLHHHAAAAHHAAAMHHHHHATFSSGPPPPTTPYTSDSTRNVLLQNATLPTAELNSTGPYGNVTMGLPPNLGSAVASSMHLTNSTDPLSDPASHYKMIESSDMLSYYPNTTNIEMSNQTTEGFLSSILNDDDLQLMDMAMNEGMYTMRMLDSASNAHHGALSASHEANISVGTGINSTGPSATSTTEDRMEASSDSAVSSMGSERVPPITDTHMSDNEWSESEHHSHSSPYGLDYQSKLRGYDYYNKDRSGPPVAQKKHQMFGKRFPQEHGSGISHPYSLASHPGDLPLPYPSTSGLQATSSLEPPEMKYSCSLDFSRHHSDVRVGGTPGSGIQNNHTYSLPPTHPDNILLNSRVSRGPTKEKQPKIIKDFKSEEHLSRDEKRARTMGLPMTTDDIINLPMDEFNERLSKYDLTETQLSLIRDIRRRGKNKVAAQNCRKRKLDQILQLADEVQRIRDKKSSLLRDENNLSTRRNILRDKYAALYRHVFQALRDPEGNPYSTHEYTLQQAADGNIVLVPRNSSIPSTTYGSNDNIDSHSQQSRRGRSKDDMKKDGHS